MKEERVGTGKATTFRKGEDLPSSYGITTLVLMPVDPETLYTYWEVGEEDFETAKDGFDSPPGRSDLVLCIYDSEDSVRDHPVFTSPVPQKGGRVINRVDPEKVYEAELGLRSENEYIPLVRSTGRATPPLGPMKEVKRRKEKPVPATEPVENAPKADKIPGRGRPDRLDITDLTERAFAQGVSSRP